MKSVRILKLCHVSKVSQCPAPVTLVFFFSFETSCSTVSVAGDSGGEEETDDDEDDVETRDSQFPWLRTCFEILLTAGAGSIVTRRQGITRHE